MAVASVEKELMVGRWAALLKDMPGSDYSTRDPVELEGLCARCYDALVAALAGSDDELYLFIRETVAQRPPRGAPPGDVLRALWSFRGVAIARGWSLTRLLSFDRVVWQVTSACAELCQDARAEHGYLSVMTALAVSLDSKDKDTSAHCRAVQRAAEIVAADLGIDIGYAGLFHDIGKINVPDHILLKPDKLTPAEYDVVKQHTVHAYHMLSPLPSALPSEVLQHHERPDGRGYPLGLTEVSLPAGVVAVVDTLHAIVSDRPYRPARPFDEAVEIINEVRGTQLRDEPVAAFNRVKEAVREELLREVSAGAS